MGLLHIYIGITSYNYFYNYLPISFVYLDCQSVCPLAKKQYPLCYCARAYLLNSTLRRAAGKDDGDTPSSLREETSSHCCCLQRNRAHITWCHMTTLCHMTITWCHMTVIHYVWGLEPPMEWYRLT